MGTSAYWKNDDMQRRYRELHLKKAQLIRPLNPDDEPLALKVYSLNDWKAQTGSIAGYTAYLNASRAVGDIYVRLPASESARLERSFEALPDGVASALLEELLASKPSVPWSSDGAVTEFRKMPEGAILADEWGQDTRRNLAIVRARLFRAIDNMDEDEIPAFMGWLEGLSVLAAASIYRKLAA